MTRDELAALPAVLDVPTAAKVLGIGRSLAYQLIRSGQWPSVVLHVGTLIKIPTAPLLAVLDGSPGRTLFPDQVPGPTMETANRRRNS